MRSYLLQSWILKKGKFPVLCTHYTWYKESLKLSKNKAKNNLRVQVVILRIMWYEETSNKNRKSELMLFMVPNV